MTARNETTILFIKPPAILDQAVEKVENPPKCHSEHSEESGLSWILHGVYPERQILQSLCSFRMTK
jgi:hypothetical protein